MMAFQGRHADSKQCKGHLGAAAADAIDDAQRYSARATETAQRHCQFLPQQARCGHQRLRRARGSARVT